MNENQRDGSNIPPNSKYMVTVNTNTGESTDIYDGYPPCFKMKGYAWMG